MFLIMSSVSRRRISNMPKMYVPPKSQSVNPVMFQSEPITAPPMVGGNLKEIGKAVRKTVKPVARVVRKVARPAGQIASLGADVAGLIPDERAQAVSKGLRVASQLAPVVEKGAKLAGGRRRIPASVGTASIGGRMSKKAVLKKM